MANKKPHSRGTAKGHRKTSTYTIADKEGKVNGR
nr:MAG TPA: hypothetical protein [Caudoviricetes sp.]